MILLMCTTYEVQSRTKTARR